MKVSVIVPAFNEEKLIAQSLASINTALGAFTRLGWETELIVCDNNSTDGTARLAREAGAKVVFEPVNQISRARNTGARTASGVWLIFVDADSHPSRELFGDVAAAIQSGRCIAGGSTLRMEENLPLVRWVLVGWNTFSRASRYLAGSFVFCDAKVFQELGGFNEQLFVSEEIELSRRLKKAARRRGGTIVILHRHPMATSPRKVHLYSLWEHLRFLARILLGFGAPMKDREACHTWYDGRR